MTDVYRKIAEKGQHPPLITVKKSASRERSGRRSAVENEHQNTSDKKGYDGHREGEKGSLPFCEERVVDGEEDESYKIF